VVRDQGPCICCYPHRARLGGLFHSGGDIDRVSERGVLDFEVGSDLAHHNQASVDTHPNSKRNSPAPLDLIAVGHHALRDLQASAHRPHRIVLMSNGRTKEGQNGVAKKTGQGSFIAVDRGDEVFERPIDDFGPVLRIHSFGS
jgi:hypothetical protein